jgi:hypothetical protein
MLELGHSQVGDGDEVGGVKERGRFPILFALGA